MVNYDAYATTFSNSRKDLKWPELDAIIEDMSQCGYTSVLDVGCGNGRFLETWNIGENSELEVGGKKMKTQNGESEGDKLSESDESNILMSEANEFLSPSGAFGTFHSWKVRKENTGHRFPTKVLGNDEDNGDIGFFVPQNDGKKISSKLTYLGIDNSSGMIAEARKLHGEYQFEVCPMESLSSHPTIQPSYYDAIIFLASFHHLETREQRLQVLDEIKKYLAPGWAIYMTNWNLREQPRYKKSHRWDGDYDIKIWEYSRYYHGFTLEELEGLFHTTGYQIIENKIFEWGKNIWSKIQQD